MSYDTHDYVGFGAHADKTWGELLRAKPDYLMWLRGKTDDHDLADFLDDLFVVTLTLAEDQAQAANLITQHLLEGGSRCFRLEGGAGYGKSYVVTDIAQRAKQLGYRVTGMATSYVASQVLAESLAPVGVPSATVARALCLVPDTTSAQEKYITSADTHSELDKLTADKSLIVVDEYSMIDDTVVGLIYSAMNHPAHSRSRLLVVGDPAQLPSPAQRHPCQFNQITPFNILDIPKRFNPGSVLHHVELAVRENPRQLKHLLDLMRGEEQVWKADSKTALFEKYTEDLHLYPDTTSLCLYFRRNDVVSANSELRKIIFGENADELYNGERLRVMRTTFIDIDHRYYSGTFITVQNLKTKTIDIPLSQLKGWEKLTPMEREKVPFKTFSVICHTSSNIPILFSKSENQADPKKLGGEQFNKQIKALVEFCSHIDMWSFYHHIRNRFVQVNYAYATTIHRAQGASVDRIYIQPDLILNSGHMANQLAYVAATRAKYQINYC